MMPKTALAFLALALLTVTSAPIAEDVDAREIKHCVREPCNEPGVPCVYGSESRCLITFNCVREPCEPRHVP